LVDIYPFFYAMDDDRDGKISAEDWAEIIFSDVNSGETYSKDELYEWFLANAREIC